MQRVAVKQSILDKPKFVPQSVGLQKQYIEYANQYEVFAQHGASALPLALPPLNYPHLFISIIHLLFSTLNSKTCLNMLFY